ncbi:hypothetical protein, partial [Microcoleus sp. AR_TQ3_B6]|uniref:hypothetical protein n=1 Tax=Microcoleus sp. AR_TQ3_B6 TaxID=3055284 RepID=UPI002FD38368
RAARRLLQMFKAQVNLPVVKQSVRAAQRLLQMFKAQVDLPVVNQSVRAARHSSPSALTKTS